MASRANSYRILVLDGDQAAALCIVRSLDRHHYCVDLASATEKPLASASRAVNITFLYPHPLQRQSAFLDWLREHTRHISYDLIIPVTERTLVPLHQHRQDFTDLPIAMAPAEALDQVLDKTKTFQIAESLGVSTPKSLYLENVAQLQDLPNELEYPVVIKPSHSVSGSNLSYSKQNVGYAANREILLRRCRARLKHSPVLLQNYFHGQGVGIELIAETGNILYAFQHMRLHEVPLSGGGSSLRVSTPVEPELLAATEKLIGELQWSGVAMVEFKWNSDSRRYCLMEINGRFWGSLPLAVAAGADFPAMLAELMLEGAVKKRPPYRQSVYARNLSRDLMWHEMVLRAKSDTVTTVPSLASVLRDLGKAFSPRHYFDIQSLSDPLPGLIEIQMLAYKYFTRMSSVIARIYYTNRQKLLWHNGTVREMLRNASSILFVCYGNINRSPLAAKMLENSLGNCKKITVLSSGFHDEAARPADPRMVEIAASRHIDLSQHQSCNLSPDMIHQSDVIFVMEKAHHDRLTAMVPDAAEKIFLLGGGTGLSPRSTLEIPDPYNKNNDAYTNCFLQLQDAVQRLVTLLQPNAPSSTDLQVTNRSITRSITTQ